LDKRSYIPFLLGGSMAIGLWLGSGMRHPFKNHAPAENWNKVEQILQYVENDYVDNVSREKLESEVIAYLLQRLDPHSLYISGDHLGVANESLEGNFEGIGVQFNLREDTIYIVNVIPSGPSEKAGLQAGDLIVKVDSAVIAGTELTNQKVMSLLKGPSGSSVNVSVKRIGVKELIAFSIERGQIPISSFDAIYKLNDTTIYVRLAQFSLTTCDEFQRRVYPLYSEKVNSFVMDLRGNGGGFLDAAVVLADEFLADGQLITYTEGKNRPKREYLASDKGKFEDVALSVIIDGYSASASEIFAGAMQDLDRATIVGRRSFGKGLVQEQNEWDDGSATRLTVARYYTPSGNSIQKPYESFSDHMTGPNDTVEGGINPDWWVENDTVGITWFYAELVHSGMLNEFAYTYRDAHFKELQAMGPDIYTNQWQADILKSELRDFSKNKSIPFLEQEWNRSIDKIVMRAKALIGRSLFSDEVYFKLINQSDPFVIKAQKEMKKPKPKTSV